MSKDSIIEAGKLNRQIDILIADTTRNSYGEPLLNHTTSVAPFWANVTPGKGNEAFLLDQPIASADIIFTIHYTTLLTPDPSMIVRYPISGTTKDYNIKQVINVEDADIRYDLMCNRVAT